MKIHLSETEFLKAELKRLQDDKQALAAPVQPVKPSLWEQYHAAQTAPVEPDWKAEYLKSVESGCITLDELREARAELDATNRQVEILSDALAESRREVTALNAAQPAPVQEPVIFYRCNGCGHAYEQIPPTSCDCMDGGGFDRVDYYTTLPAQPAPVQEPVAWVTGFYAGRCVIKTINPAAILPVGVALYTTPPAAQPAVPDALTSADIQEHIEYVAGWNDCRQAMLEMMK
jgi:rubrerythrin